MKLSSFQTRFTKERGCFSLLPATIWPIQGPIVDSCTCNFHQNGFSFMEAAVVSPTLGHVVKFLWHIASRIQRHQKHHRRRQKIATQSKVPGMKNVRSVKLRQISRHLWQKCCHWTRSVPCNGGCCSCHGGQKSRIVTTICEGEVFSPRQAHVAYPFCCCCTLALILLPYIQPKRGESTQNCMPRESNHHVCSPFFKECLKIKLLKD